ncbi:helix-turn-helix domain-containing protein [Streptomyces profundus]|uniref:helix-turn-helix domain-containing protein n=1 Tax=Streptomyces profundus TaxID=2867410 RepID=UPI001D16129D|nr:helix-turn-helix transcriptional regulator [Streptomyces sp. MA3_2.13]UED86478.1 helix-turn-helix domain-containing protein [Streptomyces sp. MA3_2.13]
MTTASPVVRRRRLGQELRRLRENANLKSAEVARKLKWTASKMSRTETGRWAPTLADVTAFLDLFEVHGEEREKLIKLAKEARKKGWWQLYTDIPYSTYIGLEAEAKTILTYQPVIPGLFQTSRYAEAVNRSTVPGMSDDTAEQRHDVRLQRQELLKLASPVQIRAVIDESAIARVVGGPQVMKEQLGRLLELCERPNILLQVIPFSNGAHPGTLVGPFVILQFEHQEDPDVVYVESNSDPYVRDSERYELLFDNLRANAASIPQTLALIKNRMSEL